jgi:hypothetical protein
MAVPTTLSNRARTFLSNLARRGDYTAQGVLYGAGTEDVKGTPKLVTLTNVPAKSNTAVHANFGGDAAPVAPDTKVRVTTAITNPTFARNVSATFGAGWDGGDILIEGTDQFGKAVSETITATTSNTVAGTKIFKTVTRISYTGGGSAGGTNVCSVGIGDKLACGTVKLQTDAIQIIVAGVLDSGATVDLTYSAFTPSASYVADGAKDYEVFATA